MSEPFPYKREFIDPDELWKNGLENNYVKKFVASKKLTWLSVPKNIPVLYKNRPWVFIVSDQAYDQLDKLTDYFSEPARMQAHMAECPSPSEFYQKNYSMIANQARLDAQQDQNRYPFRHYLREAIYRLTKECNTFRISLAKSIIQFLKANIILDPSAGWGDRILGAALAGAAVYHGVDPNPNMRQPYDEIIKFIQDRRDQIPALDRDSGLSAITDFYILTEDFLKTAVNEDAYDCVFTSPPFFDYEIYIEDPKQSISGRKEVNIWINEFLFPYLTKAWKALKRGGHLALYISDIKERHYTEQMYTHVTKTLKGEFLGILGVSKTGLSHGQPIWVWKKT